MCSKIVFKLINIFNGCCLKTFLQENKKDFHCHTHKMEDILLLILCNTKAIYVFVLDKYMLLVYQINEQPKLIVTFITWSTLPVQKSIDVSILPIITQPLWYQMPYPFSILVPNVTPIMLMIMTMTMLMGIAPLKTSFAI